MKWRAAESDSGDCFVVPFGYNFAALTTKVPVSVSIATAAIFAALGSMPTISAMSVRLTARTAAVQRASEQNQAPATPRAPLVLLLPVSEVLAHPLLDPHLPRLDHQPGFFISSRTRSKMPSIPPSGWFFPRRMSAMVSNRS